MIESLNTDCFCISLDREALKRELAAEGAPHLFAELPVFVSREHVDAMARVIGAVEEVAALPAYREAALSWAPAIARHDPGTRGVFMGYDFHLGAEGPRLIEINTNAGGAMVNVVLGRAQRACCDEVASLESGPVPLAELEGHFVAMFEAEWRAAGRPGRPERIAIVDEEPQAQFLYPEFLLFAELFRRSGIEAAVLSPRELAFKGGALRDAQGRPVPLVYNRLTDFSLENESSAALRAAYLAGAAVLTPHPRAHALYADKRNLSLLTDRERLRAWGVPEATVAVLVAGVARTELVRPAEAARLWSGRRKLFFKPATGFGSKAAYRGEKLTQRVWDEIVRGRYVAQELVRPSERRMGPGCTMKVDIRNYAYAARVQLLAARLYQGQTTNFRTERGGFAPVVTLPAHAAASITMMA